MGWEDLHGEVLGMFGTLEGCVDIHADARRGFHLWDPEARAALEKGRREYKTAKQRVYDAARRAGRRCVACSGPLGRPYRHLATCEACGAKNFIETRKEAA